VQLTPKQGQLAYEVVSLRRRARSARAMGAHCAGETAAQAETRIDIAQVRSRCDEVQAPEKIYEQIRGEGLIVGRTFEPMKQIFLNDGEALAELSLTDESRATGEDYVLHPALLTGAFQTALIGNRRGEVNTRKYIPIGMDELEILAPIPADCWIYSRPRARNVRNEEMRKFDVEICRPTASLP
jgi:polyketide synthase PksN